LPKAPTWQLELVELTTLRLRVVDLTNAPPRLTTEFLLLFALRIKSIL